MSTLLLEISKINSAVNIDVCFSILKKISRSQDENERIKYLYRLLDKKHFLPSVSIQIINDLLLQSGCNQYVENVKDTWSAMELAYFQSDFLPHVRFHKAQMQAVEKLNSEERLILSAPTSFGKSLLIEEIVAKKAYKNIAIIQPTLALLDETRKKLKKYQNDYKLVYSAHQKVGEKNIFLLTPERFIDFENIPKIDFFVIDEFYKLSDEDQDRSVALNQAFYRLIQNTDKFYLLGPLVDSIPDGFQKIFPNSFTKSNFETVALNFTEGLPRTFEVLEEMLKKESEPSLIYCAGPSTSENLARDFAKSITTNADEFVAYHKDAKEWISKNIHADWSLLECLEKGVGFHHGAMPRHVGKYLVDSFNDKKIKYLFCTSTLMEGVNTSAKSVYIYDLKKGKSNSLTNFDFRNISGRAGRLGRYYVGNVYTFGEIPQPKTQPVDFLWLTQDKATDELLIQIEEKDLQDQSKKRVEDIKKNSSVEIETLRQNSSISIVGQNSLSEHLKKNPSDLRSLSNWTSFPTYDQLLLASNLIWGHLILKPQNKTSIFLDEISSGPQLTLRTWKYYQQKSIRGVIDEVIASEIAKLDDVSKNNPEKIHKLVNTSIRNSMTVSRRWFEFRLPKLLITLNRICSSVDPNFAGDFTVFATSIENGFLRATLSSLKEIGIPIEVAAKIEKLISQNGKDDLEIAVAEIKRIIAKDPSKFDSYELYLLKDIT